MSDVDDIIDREASPGHAARIAAVIASDFRFTYFGSAAFAVQLLRLGSHSRSILNGTQIVPLQHSHLIQG
jgi:hypothetical protein